MNSWVLMLNFIYCAISYAMNENIKIEDNNFDWLIYTPFCLGKHIANQNSVFPSDFFNSLKPKIIPKLFNFHYIIKTASSLATPQIYKQVIYSPQLNQFFIIRSK
jgi:hypothetical protein